MTCFTGLPDSHLMAGVGGNEDQACWISISSSLFPTQEHQLYSTPSRQQWRKRSNSHRLFLIGFQYLSVHFIEIGTFSALDFPSSVQCKFQLEQVIIILRSVLSLYRKHVVLTLINNLSEQFAFFSQSDLLDECPCSNYF